MNIGRRVQRQTTVPDGPAITATLRDAMSRSDVVIVTGGIGPTSDDISREAVAEVLNEPLLEDANSLAAIQAFFSKRDRPMAEENKKQALCPKGAEMLPNPNGTAPGIHSPASLSGDMQCAIFLLPGPPGEMKPMFLDEVVHRLQIKNNKATSRTLRFTGIGESDFHAKLNAPFSKIADLEVGYCARPGEVDLRLIGSLTSVEKAAKLANKAFSAECFSTSEESLEAAVVKSLIASDKKLTTVESCTGGRIANRITDVSGASSVFTHGYVTYSNDAKHEMLGVRQHLLDTYGAVSEPVAIAMAECALAKSSADIAVAVTGIAGPTGGSQEKPVGTVWLAIATAEKSIATHEYYPRGRETFKQLVSQKALDLVRRTMAPPAQS